MVVALVILSIGAGVFLTLGFFYALLRGVNRGRVRQSFVNMAVFSFLIAAMLIVAAVAIGGST